VPHARLVRLPLRWRPSKLPIAILATIALLAEPRVGTASSITSRTLIDPVGEYTGDVFGCSVAWVGDVNGDGYGDRPGDPHLAAKRTPEWCLLRGRDARGPPADPQDGLVGRSALNGRR
jgi:hypothetical protein